MPQPSVSSRSIQLHPRFPVQARVVRYDGQPAYWQSVNLSEGGAYISGATLFRPGTELDLGMWLPAEPEAVEITGRAQVVWTNDRKTTGSVPHLPAGMGLKFLALDSEVRTLLTSYLREQAANADHVIDDRDVVEVGTVVASYRILDHIGSGGMGDVYVAEHTTLGRLVALKRLHRRFTSDPESVARFIDEGRVVNRIKHENIVEITDFICDNTDKYCVMELLEGETLGQLLDREGRQPVARVLRIGEQLCDALEAVHASGVIHRDLKPNNVFLAKRPDGSDFVKLLDFGIAKLKGEGDRRADRTKPGVVVGTPIYMAPEQCLGTSPDLRADLYSLGVLLYHALVGRPPFDGGDWSEVMMMQVTVPATPPSVLGVSLLPDLEALILQCLEKKPKKRPQHAREIGERLWAMETTMAIDDAVVSVVDGTAAIASELGPRSRCPRPPESPASAVNTEVALPPVPQREPSVGRWARFRWALQRFTHGQPRALPFVAVGILLLSIGAAAFLWGVRRSPVGVDEETLILAVQKPELTAVQPVVQSPPPSVVLLRTETAIPVTAEPAATVQSESPPRAEEPAPSGFAKTVKKTPRLSARESSKLLDDAAALIKAHDLMGAIRICHDVLHAQPKNGRAYRTLGVAYALMGSTGHACEAYRRYLKLAPGAADREAVLEILKGCPG